MRIKKVPKGKKAVGNAKTGPTPTEEKKAEGWGGRNSMIKREKKVDVVTRNKD